LLVFFTEAGITVWSSRQCVRIGYEMTQLAVERDALISYQKGLRVELQNLKSPERIRRIGEEELGLVTPASEQVVVVE
jgi:cell division protein FtsL